MRRIKRTALRYHGGKWRASRRIIAEFPPHQVYVEAYAGGAGVLLAKPPAYLDVYNDLNHGACNFFQVLRDRPAELIAALRLTPYCLEEYRRAAEPTDDPLESARRFYVRSWQGRSGGGTKGSGGWRRIKRPGRSTTPVDDWTSHQLWPIVERMRHVQIENLPALDIIERYDHPDTLFYCDPPYVQSTRTGDGGGSKYTHEMSNNDHRLLAKTLRRLQGMAIISGYASELYDELYSGWRRVEYRAHTEGNGRLRPESLWLSPQCDARTLPLFAVITNPDTETVA